MHFAQDIQQKMLAELAASVDRCESDVMAFISPLEQLTKREVEKVEASQARLRALQDTLESLKQRAANVE